MTHIKVKTTCPICEKENITSARRPHWHQPHSVKQVCHHCGSEFQLKLVRIPKNPYDEKEVEVFQTLVTLGKKTNPRMIQGAIHRASEKYRKGFWSKLLQKVGLR